MQIALAYTSLAVTLGLVVTRPRVGRSVRIGPAPAAAVGVAIMLLARIVTFADLADAARVMGRPLLAIVAIMVTTAVAERIGLLERAAGIALGKAGTATRLFFRVFVLSALTAAALNNDSAVLLLTPPTVVLVRRRFPGRPELLAPFTFAVFMAAGVAPLVLSNPMNMIFAAYAGIDFNAYAIRMTPLWALGGVLSAACLWLVFRKLLAGAPSSAGEPTEPLTAPQKQMLFLLAAVLGVCPFVAYFGGQPWVVAVVGAVVALAFIAPRARLGSPIQIARQGIAWDILAFLVLVSVLGVGLRNAGLVGHLAALYERGGTFTVGLASAIGSAVLNNHPMSILNMLALQGPAHQEQALAALVGGDLGPRLLPAGSLAGLLWLGCLRRLGVHVALGRFVLIGILVTVPTLALSLALLRVF